ncbi:DUF654-domain-containing protein [Hyphopichia burtonii NRRL Y-1933]|uniref:DUF654-domain-containing protein n=1 Tax=Hyphopichia burtonii NRRL Y-1933 TaxID=984485 RepID=A0A1E4RNR6_9ASCO|nr:DUF654-domain-containing protein [Hyphopichia burtonii NRRL Y-1933]ODV68924.1 DUF654-domain-containing protein [Hyphopichia burtonii NRRL Y-1933]
MSSRALRRLEQQRIQEEAERNEQERAQNSGEDSENDYQDSKQPAFNAFSLLNEQDEETDSGNEDAPETVSPPEPKPEPVSLPSKKSKKKSKSKKKQQKKNNQEKETSADIDSDEELDKILAEVKLKDKSGDSSENTSSSATPQLESYDFEYDVEEEFDEDIKPSPHFDSNFKRFTSNRLKQSLRLLSIQSIKNLDPDQELSNLFGNLSKDTIEDANQTTALSTSPEVLAQFKKLARLTRGWCGKDRRSVPGTTRKLLLSRIKDDYLPTAAKPLNMEELKMSQIVDILDYKEDSFEREELNIKVKKELALGVKYFKFNKVRSIQDRVANTRFYHAAVLTPDPDSLMQLLQQNPYHEETLFQVAMVMLRQGGDKSISNSLVEKGLFVFDRSFHKKFHELLYEGKNGLLRLPYEGFVNRQFYLGLFRYIINLGERSMFFTALNYCKFLLSLSPSEDPLGVRYFIDFYAILAEEFKYLIQFSESPLSTTYSKWNTPGIAFSTVLAFLRLNDKEGARKALISAYSQHPYAAYKLLEAIGLSQSLPVKEHELPTTPEILIASETYLVRAPLLWKEQEERNFLHDELLALFKSQPFEKNTTSFSQSIFQYFTGSSKPEDGDGEIPFNLIRFAILSGENKIMAKLPEAIFSRDDVFEYDVLPPRDPNSTRLNHFLIREGHQVTDSMLDYVDQNLLGAIVQERTGNSFEDILNNIEGQMVDEQVNDDIRNEDLD